MPAAHARRLKETKKERAQNCTVQWAFWISYRRTCVLHIEIQCKAICSPHYEKRWSAYGSTNCPVLVSGLIRLQNKAQQWGETQKTTQTGITCDICRMTRAQSDLPFHHKRCSTCRSDSRNTMSSTEFSNYTSTHQRFKTQQATHTQKNCWHRRHEARAWQSCTSICQVAMW